MAAGFKRLVAGGRAGFLAGFRVLCSMMESQMKKKMTLKWQMVNRVETRVIPRRHL